MGPPEKNDIYYLLGSNMRIFFPENTSIRCGLESNTSQNSAWWHIAVNVAVERLSHVGMHARKGENGGRGHVIWKVQRSGAAGIRGSGRALPLLVQTNLEKQC